MPAQEGFLCVQQQGQTVSCQVVGRATMRQTPALRQRVEQSLGPGSVILHVDLHECTYMDSTFLGTLVMFKRMAGDHRLGQFALVAPSAECSRLLRQSGLGSAFCVLDKEAAPIKGGEVLESASGGSNFKRTIVEAHQELAEVPGPAGEIFREVAVRLTHEWEAEQVKATVTEGQ